MKYHIALLFPLIFISNYSLATTSQEITSLITSAKQQYKAGNYSDSISLYKQAEKLGSPDAMLSLSTMYKNGKGVTINESLANQYVQKATALYENKAKDGDTNAEYNLGRIYSYYIKPADKPEAYKHFLKAANNNHMKAQYAVATFLDTGSAGKRDYEEAMKWYEKSAIQGNSSAAFKLVYRNRGDFDYVIKWCLPIAKRQDDRVAPKCLEAINVIVGRKIHSKKYKEKSIEVIHELANSNIVMSQVTLSMMYKKGDVITKDIEKSEKWEHNAFNNALSKAQQGNKQSQYELALLYQRGIGTNIYLDQTEKWLNKSAKQGYKPAIKALAKFKKK